MSVIVALLDGNGITTMTRTVVRTAPPHRRETSRRRVSP